MVTLEITFVLLFTSWGAVQTLRTHEMFVRKLLVEMSAPSSSPSACRHSLLHFPLPAMDLPGRSQACQWIWDLWRRWTQSESRWSHRRQSCSCQRTWPQHRWGHQVISGEEERLNHSLMKCMSINVGSLEMKSHSFLPLSTLLFSLQITPWNWRWTHTQQVKIVFLNTKHTLFTNVCWRTLPENMLKIKSYK